MARPFDVAIVGYGPTGGTLANLLGQAGLRVAVLERDAEVLQMPRAAHFDGEVMRVFQQIGLTREVMSISRASTKGMHFVNADGEVLMIRAGSDRPGIHGYTNNWYFHQPHLERVLREGVPRYPQVEVLLGHEVVDAGQSSDFVEVELATAEGARRTLAARYVVGCDGARSILRKVIGSQNEDLGLHQPWLCIDLLMQRDVGLAEHTVQLCDPGRPMTLVNMAGNRRRWEIMLMPGDDIDTIATPESAWRILSPWVTPADALLERSAVYTFHSVIARQWRDRRILLAGDAAHQTPPFLGQGMCAGIRDAANLWWKLDLACTGRAPDTILDSYESERSPHVRAFIDLAVRLGAIIQTTDVSIAAERDRRFREGGTEVFAFPNPALGPGLREDAPPPVGTIVPQFALEAGLLDDVVGPRFALMVSRDLHAYTLAAVSRSGIESLCVLHDGDGAMTQWLAQNRVGAALARPDRYVFGTADSPDDIDRMLAALPISAPRPEHA